MKVRIFFFIFYQHLRHYFRWNSKIPSIRYLSCISFYYSFVFGWIGYDGFSPLCYLLINQIQKYTFEIPFKSRKKDFGFVMYCKWTEKKQHNFINLTLLVLFFCFFISRLSPSAHVMAYKCGGYIENKRKHQSLYLIFSKMPMFLFFIHDDYVFNLFFWHL